MPIWQEPILIVASIFTAKKSMRIPCSKMVELSLMWREIRSLGRRLDRSLICWERLITPNVLKVIGFWLNRFTDVSGTPFISARGLRFRIVLLWTTSWSESSPPHSGRFTGNCDFEARFYEIWRELYDSPQYFGIDKMSVFSIDLPTYSIYSILSFYSHCLQFVFFHDLFLKWGEQTESSKTFLVPNMHGLAIERNHKRAINALEVEDRKKIGDFRFMGNNISLPSWVHPTKHSILVVFGSAGSIIGPPPDRHVILICLVRYTNSQWEQRLAALGRGPGSGFINLVDTLPRKKVDYSKHAPDLLHWIKMIQRHREVVLLAGAQEGRDCFKQCLLFVALS